MQIQRLVSSPYSNLPIHSRATPAPRAGQGALKGSTTSLVISEKRHRGLRHHSMIRRQAESYRRCGGYKLFDAAQNDGRPRFDLEV